MDSTTTALYLPSPYCWIWAAITLGFLAASFLSLMASYYPHRFLRSSPPSLLWTERFRKVRGLDHTGVWMEFFFAALLAVNFFCLAYLVYPDAAMHLMEVGWPLAWHLVLLVVLAAIVLVKLLSASHQREVVDEIRQGHPKIMQTLRADEATRRGIDMSNLGEQELRERLETEAGRLRQLYKFYAIHCVVAWWMLGGGTFLFVFGVLEQARGRLAPTRIQLEQAADLDSIRFEQEKESSEDGVERIQARLRWGEALLERFVQYREILLRFVNQFLGAIGLFSLPFIWLLGTRYQDLCMPSIRRTYRSLASVFLLLLLPGIILSGYFVFASTSRHVEKQFARIVTTISWNGDEQEDAPDLSRVPYLELAHLNDLRSRFLDEASLPGFLGRVAGSWGGTLIILQFLLSRVGASRIEASVWDSLIPDFRFIQAIRERAKLIFADPRSDILWETTETKAALDGNAAESSGKHHEGNASER